MYKKIYFSGIGGIGMSALARYYLSLGVEIIGSDIQDSDIIQDLIKEGVVFYLGHKASNLDNHLDMDLFVYTIAVSENNSELVRARELSKLDNEGESNFEILTYAQALGQMIKNKKTIAICGTHGKTTTTAMAFYAFREAGLNVSVIVGSLLEVEEMDNFGNLIKRKTNYLSHINQNRNNGDLDYLIIEACEYKRSFLNYDPEIIVITNIEADHLDYYRDLNDIENAFTDFIYKLPENGILITHQDLIHKFDFKNKIATSEMLSKDIKLSVIGDHNRENANLILSLGQALNLNMPKFIRGLESFKGTWRRQEYKFTKYELVFYDDYAHHPREIEVTIKAFKDHFPNKKIIVAFMPHLYSRTKLLFDGFVKSLSLADKVFVLPIYAAREIKDPNINSQMLVNSLNLTNNKNYTNVSIVKNKVHTLNHEISATENNVSIAENNVSDLDNNVSAAKSNVFVLENQDIFCSNFANYIDNTSDLINYIKNNNFKGDIFITMGAGPIDDIYKSL